MSIESSVLLMQPAIIQVMLLTKTSTEKKSATVSYHKNRFSCVTIGARFGVVAKITRCKAVCSQPSKCVIHGFTREIFVTAPKHHLASVLPLKNVSSFNF